MEEEEQRLFSLGTDDPCDHITDYNIQWTKWIRNNDQEESRSRTGKILRVDAVEDATDRSFIGLGQKNSK
jgi:hypothetical protein